MNVRHDSVGRQVLIVFADGEERVRAIVGSDADARRAAALLDKARDLNDRQRKYTAAARAIAECQALPGFRWVNEGGNK